MPDDIALRDHRTWLNYLQPDGLVVSPAALVDAQATLNRNVAPLQERFVEFIREPDDGADDLGPRIADLASFLGGFLAWPDDCLHGLNGARPIPDELRVDLPELGAVLAPTVAFRDPASAEGRSPWLLLVGDLAAGTDLDREERGTRVRWSASESQRFERLLRATGVPIGLLTNRTHLRLFYAPTGESTGTVTFPVQAMVEVSGRLILAAFDLLLNRMQLLSVPPEARLPALLRRSREYQSTVSTRLAQQVLDALWDLLRGFQAADERAGGELLRKVLAAEPDKVYSALLTVLFRLVFLLYVEDRRLMPGSELYLGNYSVHRLYERLRVDHEHFPDTMDDRYGAWVQLLALFRVLHDGCRHPELQVPARKGHLFDPERFPFLEGANLEHAAPPLVADGVVYRVLERLIVLDGERLSYRALDIEDIGSVYQTIMGFKLEIASGLSVALRGKRKHKGEVPAPNVIDLEELLRVKPPGRAKWVLDSAGHDITGNAEAALKDAADVDGLLAALERRIDRGATPHPVPKGSLVLQPTDERRKSGSHYTPRSLTEPIVRKTLEPILGRLGDKPTPEQILDLKVCDLAMGSAAFLVEAARQLAEVLVRAWHSHDQVPSVPPDEDELLLARRIVAQRCLYGVDRNPMAVDLAKLSLWLATLAKDHPFTFLDHNLRCGDSLVGLTNRQIAAFHWDLSAAKERVLGQDEFDKLLERVTRARAEILQMVDDNPASVLLKREKLAAAEGAANTLRQNGDLAIAAFFAGVKPRERQEKRDEYLAKLLSLRRDVSVIGWLNETIAELKSDPLPVRPFHWELEFPEVFGRDNPGFDAIVGNPPFAGVTSLSESNRAGYTEWLRTVHAGSGGKCDLVAFCFRRAFALLRASGCFGLLATKTIRQGDTRASSLEPILSTMNGTVFSAERRRRWPGQAAVVVCTVHLQKGSHAGQVMLDGTPVDRISAYLMPGQLDTAPKVLSRVRGDVVCGYGNKPNDGGGFMFTAHAEDGFDLAAKDRLLAEDAQRGAVLRPYLGGSDLNKLVAEAPSRWIIDFGDRTLEEAALFPALLKIAEKRVKPHVRRSKWWQFEHRAQTLKEALSRSGVHEVLVVADASDTLAFRFVPSTWCLSNSVVGFSTDSRAMFALLQSRLHECWVRLVSLSLKDDIRYVPGHCFETFPFPVGWDRSSTLGRAGEAYHEFRADLMIRNGEGLTKTYNRFHDPDDLSPGVVRLRELHDLMDRVVLDAYGWSDIQPKCEFLLDYQEEDDDDDGGGRRRKRPYRYRWPDEVHDEVLARLLELNALRAEEERLAAADEPMVARDAPRRKRREVDDAQEELDIG